MYSRILKLYTYKNQCAVNLHRPFSGKNEDCSNVGPLCGIRVLDLTRILAGPFCTMLLGDLGAEIIKVESPDGGDETRKWGPPFVNGESAYFLSINRNKKSIAVDMKNPQGSNLIKELAVKCDVLIENFIPGKLSKFGLDYKSLEKVAPRLVYCSITGYGDTGPYSSRPGYDVIAASIGGLLNITGPQNGEPCKAGVAVTDLATGLYAHGAIMAALLERTKNGRGQKIDCNLLSTQVSLLANIGSNYLNAELEAKRWGTSHESIVPYQSFKTFDGFITVGAGSDKQFKELCEILNVSQFLNDPKFRTNKDRVENRKELVSVLTDIFSSNTNQHWMEMFEKSSIPCGPVNKMKDVFSDPQVIHNNMILNMNHTTAGNIKLAGPAVKFSDSVNKGRSPPPCFAEHTDAVLSSILLYTENEINLLRKRKVIF